MPLSGMVINRVHSTPLGISAERALSLAEDLDPSTATVEIEALRRHASLMRVIEAEARLLGRFSSSRPAVPQTQVQSLSTDVTDLESLRLVGDFLSDKD